MFNKECEDCGFIGEDDMCPECSGQMLVVDFDDDPLTRVRKAQRVKWVANSGVSSSALNGRRKL